MNIEKRIYNFTKVEVRADASGDSIIDGYASVFNKDSLDLGGFIETVNPEAFNRTLVENPDVRALFNHDSGELLGRTVSKTLTLSVDENGLRMSLRLPNTGKGPYIKEMITRGDLSAMSFGFITRKDKWDFNSTPNRRELLDVDLFEVSPVTFPAYPDTSLAVRSMEMAKNNTISEDQRAMMLNDLFETFSRRIRLAKL